MDVPVYVIDLFLSKKHCDRAYCRPFCLSCSASHFLPQSSTIRDCLTRDIHELISGNNLSSLTSLIRKIIVLTLFSIQYFTV